MNWKNEFEDILIQTIRLAIFLIFAIVIVGGGIIFMNWVIKSGVLR